MKNFYQLFILLTLPMLATAQGKSVQVPYSCGVGEAFTIKIPVKLQGKSVEYAWYRNDTVVEHVPLTAGVTTIAYTIPADKAYGYAAAYHFKYRLNDGCDEWTLSPRYLVNFQFICPAVSAPGVIGIAATAACGDGVSAPGVIGITATAPCGGGVSAPGVISIAPTKLITNN